MNYNETKEYLKRYLKARIPFIVVRSLEKNRVLRMLKEISEENGLVFNAYKMSEGIVDLKSNITISEEKTIMSALDYISDRIKHEENLNFILTDIADINDSNTVSRYLQNVIEQTETKSGTIIVISNDIIWPNISRLGITVELAYPTEEELEQTIIETIKPYKNQIEIDWTDDDYKKAAQYMQGLSEMEVKNIIASLIVNGKILKTDLKELKYSKQQLFNEIAGLEAIEVPEDLEVAGLDNLIEWLNEKKSLMDPTLKDELHKRGISSPKGILLTGVPGCGKSLCSKAASNILNIPLYRLDLATVQGEYVGQSERQLKEALDTAEYVSPCVLWIDEIEKGLKDNAASSVTSKMIGQFLFWLQENKKPVFVIASANDVSQLPPELIRKGRFDEIFFVDLPNEKERKTLLSIYFKKYNRVELGDDLLNQLVTITEGFSSADIEATIRSIAYKLIANQEIRLSEDLIKSSLQNVMSLMKTNPEKITAIREWGKERAIPASKR